MTLLFSMLDYLGIERDRTRVEWVSAAEGAKFAATMNDFVQDGHRAGREQEIGGSEMQEMIDNRARQRAAGRERQVDRVLGWKAGEFSYDRHARPCLNRRMSWRTDSSTTTSAAANLSANISLRRSAKEGKVHRASQALRYLQL